jgi:hypothetical protein
LFDVVVVMMVMMQGRECDAVVLFRFLGVGCLCFAGGAL